MQILHNNLASLEPFSLLGIGIALGFFLGVVVSIFWARSSTLFFSARLKDLSHQALNENTRKFMELAQSYFGGYVREARKDFDIKGDEILRTVDPVRQIRQI